MLTLLISIVAFVNIVGADPQQTKTEITEHDEKAEGIAEELKTLLIFLQSSDKKGPRKLQFDDFSKTLSPDDPGMIEVFKLVKDTAIEHYDPVYKVLSGNVIKNVKIHGMGTVFFNEKVDISSKSNLIRMHVPFGFQYLKMISDIAYNHVGIRINGKANVLLKDLGMIMDVFINPNTEDSHPVRVDNFKVTNWGNMDVKFEGTNALGMILQGFTKPFSILFKKMIMDNFPGILQKNINEELAKVDDLPGFIAKHTNEVIAS